MLAGKRVIILVEQDFEDSELMEPLRALREAGARVTLVGGAKRVYQGKRGNAEVMAETTADAINVDDVDALVIPGGYAPDRMRLHQPMIDLVTKMFAAGKLVAAVCHGPQLLISAEVVRGRRLTSWPSVAIDLKNAGAEWIDEPVVIDGNLITARRPADLPRFDRAIIEALAAQPGAESV